MYILVQKYRKHGFLNIYPKTGTKIEEIRSSFDIKPNIVDLVDHIVEFYAISKSIKLKGGL